MKHGGFCGSDGWRARGRWKERGDSMWANEASVLVSEGLISRVSAARCGVSGSRGGAEGESILIFYGFHKFTVKVL